MSDSGIQVQAGDKIFLKRNPSRIGIVRNETLGEGRRLRVLVEFTDNESDYFLVTELETVKSDNKSATTVECLEQGRYAWWDNLCNLITYNRLNGRLTDIIYSLNTTNTQFYAYQFKPIMQLLNSPYNGILIADEVGLGKTIEAGLIWTELKARYGSKRLLVVCPAMLREKWKTELFERFGVQADIVNANELKQKLERAEQYAHESFALITSIQGIRPPKGFDNDDKKKNNAAKLANYLSQVADTLSGKYLVDMLIIDEAHYLRNSTTSHNKIGHLLRAISEYVVLLSATPIQIHSDDLFSLVNLIDDSVFPEKYYFQQILEKMQPLVKLRDQLIYSKISAKQFEIQLIELLSVSMLSGNHQLESLLKEQFTDEYLSENHHKVELADRLERIHPISTLVTRTLKRNVFEQRVIRVPKAFKAELSEIEKEFYNKVTDLVRRYCENEGRPIGFLLTIPQKQMASCMAAACHAWQNNILTEEVDDQLEDQDIAEQTTQINLKHVFGEFKKELISIAQSFGGYEQLYENDNKYKLFSESLKKYIKENPENKIILFAFYKKTLDYLKRRLEQDGILGVVLYGGLDKQEILKNFRQSSNIKILLSSEVASEGVDLQFSSLLINYDLPWNPMKIEQRIGRIDRIGQQAERILIWNFMYGNTIDEKIYDRLLERLGVFTRTLGSIEGVLGEEISKLTKDLFSHQLSSNQEEDRIEQSKLAVERNKFDQVVLESEAHDLAAHGDFIVNKINMSKELGRYIQGRDLYQYIYGFFKENYQGTRFVPVNEDELTFRLELSIEAKLDLKQFIHQNNLSSKTALATDKAVEIIFNNQHGNNSKKVEQINQEHVLTRLLTDKIKNQKNSYFPTSAVAVSQHEVGNVKLGVYVFIIQRWSFQGATNQEFLRYQACSMREGEFLDLEQSERLLNIAVLKGLDWKAASSELNGGTVADHFADCRDRLIDLFSQEKVKKENENQDKAKQMIELVEQRRDENIKKSRERIDEWRKSWDSSKKITMETQMRMEEGKIKKQREHAEERMLELRKKAVFDAQYKFVVAGVVKVY